MSPTDNMDEESRLSLVTDVSVAQSKKPSPPLRLWLSSLVLALSGGFHFGFNLVLTNPAEIALKNFVNSSIANSNEGIVFDTESFDNRWSLYVSLLYIGALFGAFFIQPMADRLGRNRAVHHTVTGQALAVSLAIMSYFINSHVLYAFSRFLLGFFQAMTVGIAPMYMSESSPPSCRGVISLSTGLCVQTSIVISSILASPQFLGTPTTWWILYAIELGVFIIVLIVIPFLSDSPSYLLSHGRKDEAARSLHFFHGLSGLDLELAIEALRENSTHARKAVDLLGLLLDSEARGKAFTGAMVMFGMVSSGIVVINAYAFRIFLTFGFEKREAAWANIGIAVIMVMGVALSSLVIDRFGRRPLLLTTMFCVLICNCTIATLMQIFEMTKDHFYGKLIIAVICVYALVFSAGPAPLSYFISAELCPQHVRGAAMTLTAIIMAGCRSTIIAIYPLLVARIHSAMAYFLLFIPPAVICLVYLYYKLPETKAVKVQTFKEEKEEAEEDSDESLNIKEKFDS